MKSSHPIIPATVVDQIHLWEMERERLKTTNGFLYQMFNRFSEYAEVLKYANDFGYVTWHNDAKMMLFVTAEGHEFVRGYIKQKSQKT